jgi:S1-C subfamily serine protease
MRIDGIKQERPAQIAGIEKGDVVVKMGGFEVKNMTDYMNCLSKFEKGITVIVQVKRGESVLNKKVVF